MRAIRIDSKAMTVKEIDIPGDLESLQKQVGGLIEPVRGVPFADDLYVDEEGLLKDYDTGFVIAGHTLAGSGVIIGHNGEGDTRPATVSVETIRGLVHWLIIPVAERA